MTLTLIIETGEGVVDANAFETLADTKVRLIDLGYTDFSGLSDTVKETACIFQGTRTIDSSLSGRMKGSPLKSDQGLYYPRNFLIRGKEIPDDLLLLCAYSAEKVAVDRFSSSVSVDDRALESIPQEITAFEMFGGVRFEKEPGLMRSKKYGDLKIEILRLIKLLRNVPMRYQADTFATPRRLRCL